MRDRFKTISRNDINPLFTKQGREEIRIFKRNCNIFSVMMVVVSWIVAYFYEFGNRTCAGYNTRQDTLGLCLDFNFWGDLFEGAFYPFFMAIGGNPLGWFIVAITFMAFFIYSGFSKKIGVIMFLSSALLSNYATFGLLIKPLYMLATFAAPIIFIVLGAIGTAGVVVAEVKSILKDFLK